MNALPLLLTMCPHRFLRRVERSPLVTAEGRAVEDVANRRAACAAHPDRRSAIHVPRQASRFQSDMEQRIATFLPWLTAVWFAGVFVLSLRLAFGWSAVGRLRNAGSPAVAEPLLAILSRLCRQLEIDWPVGLSKPRLSRCRR